MVLSAQWPQRLPFPASKTCSISISPKRDIKQTKEAHQKIHRESNEKVIVAIILLALLAAATILTTRPTEATTPPPPSQQDTAVITITMTPVKDWSTH